MARATLISAAEERLVAHPVDVVRAALDLPAPRSRLMHEVLETLEAEARRGAMARPAARRRG